jgi:hypothetical protein
VTGSLLFKLFTTDVISIAQSYGVHVHCYAKDQQLYVHCSPAEAPADVQRLLICLKLNPEKTQVIWLGTRQRLAAVNITPIRLHDGTVITPSTSVRNLGVILDSELTMAAHVNSVTRACFYQLRQLRFVRHLLTPDTTKMTHPLIHRQPS